MSLANKYRPANFDSLIGQEHITEILKEQCKHQGSVHHNYIFFGPRGTGKTSSARILAKGLNCQNSQNGNPCNTCEYCQIINKDQTLDYVEIDAASHTGVDNIREEILAKAIYPPNQLKKKIYIIDEVHMLSTGAFNALLKTIEEPKDNVCFILATTEIHKIPDTIISRCQVFNFKKIQEQKMTEYLAEIAKKEDLSYTPEALELISKISDGCVRDAIKYIDQISILGTLNEEHVSKFLGIASEGILNTFVETVKKGNKEQVFGLVEDIHNGGIDLLQFTKQLLLHLDKTMSADTIDFNLQLSESIGEVMSSIRYYPYPSVLYKIVLNKFLSHGINGENNTLQAPKNNTPTVSKPHTIAPHQSSKKQESKVPENKKTKSDIEKATGDATAEKKEITKQEQPQEDYNGNTLAELWEKIIDASKNESFGTALKKYCTLDTIGNTITITTINKMAEISLKKDETRKKIQDYFTKFGENKPVEIVFKNKETFLKEGLL